MITITFLGLSLEEKYKVVLLRYNDSLYIVEFYLFESSRTTTINIQS